MLTDRTRKDCQHPRANHRHGTQGAYNSDKCRCFPCRVAHSRATAAYRDGGTWHETDYRPAIGVRRRLQSLACIGHTSAAIAAVTGLTKDYVAKLRTEHRHPQILATTYDLIAAAYDDLWDKPDRSSNGRRCSTQASRLGWVPPLAWDDDEIDDPAAKPHMPEGRRFDPRPCGTQAAARRHYRRGEPLCEPCQKANARREDAA